MLNDSPAKIVRQHLIDIAVVEDETGTTWPSHTGTMPNEPDGVVVFTDTQGKSDGRNMRDGVLAEHPGLIIRVRARQEATAYGKAAVVAAALDALYNAAVTVEGTQYKIQAIHRSGSVMKLGQEEGQRRQVFSINAIVTVKEM